MTTASVARRTAAGFTLIELLVVISIIGVLAAFVTTNLAQARERAVNASVQQSVYQYVIGLNKIDAETGSFPVSDEGTGIYCLGGSDCGYNSDGDLNGTLGLQVSGAQNPNSQGVFFEGGYRKSLYLRCDDDFGTCPGDSITEVMWFLTGTDAECGYGAVAYYDAGNTACFLHIEGQGTLINETLEAEQPETEQVCIDAIDNDNDGSTDCADPDCSGESSCTTPGSETGSCNDSTDNDNDGSTDCGDSDCTGDSFCYMGPGYETSCSDGSDNDYDGYYDCGDSDCSGDSYCQPTYYTEICYDGWDNDYDYMTDCYDADCYYTGYCSGNSSGY